MKMLKSKIAMLVVVAIALLFFSNDFGLIDIEKTAIITAIAVDVEGEDFSVSMEVAVPEATDTNSENQKALLSGKGKTIGGAIKDMGDTAGWFPKLAFCNLIILGSELAETNVMGALDYFAKTLRLQDSATVILAEKTGKELLEKASPLDNIASFALQKILLKNPGFDNDVASVDIRTFCAGYYSKNASSYMPLVKAIESEGNQGNGTSAGSGDDGSSQGGSTGVTPQKGKNVFDATTTALFKNGVKVGELDERGTFAFNLLEKSARETTLKVDGVEHGGNKNDYLLTVLGNKSSVTLTADLNQAILKISVDLFCRIADVDTPSDSHLASNDYMPKFLSDRAASDIKADLEELLRTSAQTDCDVLRLKDKLYRYNHKYFATYKDNLLQNMKTEVSVIVSGQK